MELNRPRNKKIARWRFHRSRTSLRRPQCGSLRDGSNSRSTSRLTARWIPIFFANSISAVFSSIDQHLNCHPPFRRIMFCFGELLDVIGGVAERPRGGTTRQGDRLIERAFPGHNATPQRHGDSSRRAGIRSRAVPVPPSIFRRVPSCVLAPCIEVGIGALWQILSPCRFEGDACGLKGRRGAMPIVARIAARVKPTAPLPLMGRRRGARSLDDHSDADAGIMDVPGHRPIVDALAGELGHAPLKRTPPRVSNRPISQDRNRVVPCPSRVRCADL